MKTVKNYTLTAQRGPRVYIGSSAGVPYILKSDEPTSTKCRRAARHQLHHEREMGILLGDHPSFCRPIELIEDGNTSYLVTPYVGSRTLKDVSPQDAGRALAQVAEGLSYMHNLGIVHRDIKPSNVVLRNDGSAIIIDLESATSSASPREASGYFSIGTPGYMPPEQEAGEPALPSADVFALSGTVVKIITGMQAFDVEATQRLVSDTAPIPFYFYPATYSAGLLSRALPGASELTDCIIAGLSLDPSKRPLMRDVAQCLSSYASNVPKIPQDFSDVVTAQTTVSRAAANTP